MIVSMAYFQHWANLRVGVVCTILEERGFNRGFTRGTTGACRFGSELPSNEDQCTRAQLVWVVPPQYAAMRTFQ